MLKELLLFNKMITGEIIKVLFWIATAFVVLSGIFTFFVSLVTGEFAAAFGGLVIIIVGPIIVRVYCEVIIIFFKIYEVLREIRDQNAS